MGGQIRFRSLPGPLIYREVVCKTINMKLFNFHLNTVMACIQDITKNYNIGAIF